MTTLIQPTKEEKVNLLQKTFHSYGWEFKPVHRTSHVYLVYKPNHSEYCYFIAFYSDGTIKLLPSKEASESYQEAQQIISEVIG